MAEVIGTPTTLNELEKLPVIHDRPLPSDPEKQRELLERLIADGFTFRTNGGVSRDLGQIGSYPLSFPGQRVGRTLPKGPRNYPEETHNLIEAFGAENVTRVMDARLKGFSDVEPHFIPVRGAYAVFAREIKDES